MAMGVWENFNIFERPDTTEIYGDAVALWIDCSCAGLQLEQFDYLDLLEIVRLQCDVSVSRSSLPSVAWLDNLRSPC